MKPQHIKIGEMQLKVVPRGKFIVLNVYIKEKEGFKSMTSTSILRN